MISRPRLELSPRVAGAIAIAWVALLIVATVVFLVGCAVPDARSAPAGAGGPVVPVVPAHGPTIAPARPAAVTIPKLNVTSTLIPTGILPDGTAETPPVDHPEQASWLDQSPIPGDPGPAVLYGHVDGRGRAGVFHDLQRLVAGDEIVVDRDGAPSISFEVYRVEQVAKAAFPTAEVYGNTGDSELRLVTCAGSFDRAVGHYRDNVVVWARLVPAPQPLVATAPPTT